MHVKVENNQATKYSLGRLFRDNPNVSFPKTPSETILAEYGVYPLVDGVKPDNDLVTKGDIQLVDGVWTQTYVGRDYTAEEIAAQLEDWREEAQVSMRQCRLALLQSGLLANVDTVIAGMVEPDKSAITIEWEYAAVVDRSSPWMGQMGVALGLSETELDDLFKLAETL